MSRSVELNNMITELQALCNNELLNEENLNLTSVELFLLALNKFSDKLFESVEDDTSTGSSIYGTVDLDKVMFLVGAGGLAVPIGGSNESSNNDWDDG